jgi:hypothetical protein
VWKNLTGDPDFFDIAVAMMYSSPDDLLPEPSPMPQPAMDPSEVFTVMFALGMPK